MWRPTVFCGSDVWGGLCPQALPCENQEGMFRCPCYGSSLAQWLSFLQKGVMPAIMIWGQAEKPCVHSWCPEPSSEATHPLSIKSHGIIRVDVLEDKLPGSALWVANGL